MGLHKAVTESEVRRCGGNEIGNAFVTAGGAVYTSGSIAAGTEIILITEYPEDAPGHAESYEALEAGLLAKVRS